jgi:hypothetical protein
MLRKSLEELFQEREREQIIILPFPMVHNAFSNKLIIMNHNARSKL